MPIPAVVNPAQGTTLAHGVTGVYTALAQVVSLDGPSTEIGTRETTHLGSGVVKTFAPTLVDNGTVSGQIEFDPKSDTHAYLVTVSQTPVANDQWKMTFADNHTGASTATFVGHLTKLAPTGIETEANLLADFEIKISGAVTWA
jgi:hypothetical protein